jgi:hypothetical protein
MDMDLIMSTVQYMYMSLNLFTNIHTQTVLLHNGGFCNDRITKQCLHLTVDYTRNVSYNALVSQMTLDK